MNKNQDQLKPANKAIVPSKMENGKAMNKDANSITKKAGEKARNVSKETDKKVASNYSK